MVCSMTAFARQSGEGTWGRGAWEIRSVNHRYLDISIRLPDELRPLETEIRERVNRAIRRGKLECTLKYYAAGKLESAFSLNMELAGRIIDAGSKVQSLLDERAPLNALDILRWPGVLESAAIDLEQVGGPILELLDDALDNLVAARRREGSKLRSLVETRCRDARKQVAMLRDRLPQILEDINERIKTRLTEAQVELEAGRLEQELVLLAAKLDVAEELDRLDAHIEEVLRILGQDEAIGRRLDFLMQEMNREANTLGSKSAHIQTTTASVDLKVLVEQMREQVQNIE